VDYSKYAGVSVITPNRSELKQVIGRWSTEADLAQKAENLRNDLGLEAILLTRSEEGMTLFRKNSIIDVRSASTRSF
jgi:bifunctional ADP-heptose synthase (sugar kinase/adenylyltransferase)